MNHLSMDTPPLYRQVEGGSWIDEENLSLVKKKCTHFHLDSISLKAKLLHNTGKKGLKPSFLRTHPISWPFYSEDMNKASGLGKQGQCALSLVHPNRITMHDISSLLFLVSASVVKRLAAALGSLIGFTKSTASWFFMTCRVSQQTSGYTVIVTLKCGMTQYHGRYVE